jgi:hypothetical protein
MGCKVISGSSGTIAGVGNNGTDTGVQSLNKDGQPRKQRTPATAETKAKIAAARTGKKQTPDTKAKISQSMSDCYGANGSTKKTKTTKPNPTKNPTPPNLDPSNLSNLGGNN